ncbi:MAG TPA: hypothetical protein VF657_22290 [Actinoplanes sp.]|jgi:hypothetical protein
MSIVDQLAEFGNWAYDRHGNVLSWYVRPLFLLPLAWFAYRRSGWGIAGTLVALASSMFWFPAPAVPDPRVEEFLEFEKAWLAGDWDSRKILFTLLVPVAIGSYCLAFWRRSVGWGVVILNVMAVGKLLWGVLAGDGTGWAMTAPALTGLLIGNAVLLFVVRRQRTRRRPDTGTACPAEPAQHVRPASAR